jgi:Lrp/AsnC family transcriptional regulator, regulator for asnA, asnC and gidA
MSESLDIDQLDRQILAKLVEDGKTPYTEIARQLYVSSGTIHVRMRKMEDMGLVIGSSLNLNYHKLGYDVTAFLGIYLDKSSLYDEVVEQLRHIPEIVEANYTTGAYSILTKLVCKDTNHLRQVLHDKIQKITGIQRTETFISLEESISRPVNFLEAEKEDIKDKNPS